MRSRCPLRVALLAVLLACGGEPAPPHIVMIVSDDHGWGDYGFMGHPHLRTPHIDRLARESLAFTRGYVPQSICRPSLATLVTGLYPHQHRIVANDPPPPEALRDAPPARRRADPGYRARQGRYVAHLDGTRPLAKRLAAAGYRSHQSGKWWEGSYRRGGFTHGMTHGDLARGARHGDEGLGIGREGLGPLLDFVDESVARDEPFFVFYAPFLPHTPHRPPERLLERYRAATPHEPIARYWAMVEWLDETVGELLGALDERGLREETIVVYLADNGWINREDRSGFAPRSKRSPYEGGVRTPVLLRWPGRVAPARDDARLVSSIDLAPTLLAAAGLPPGPEMQGIDLLDPAAREARDAVFGEIFHVEARHMTDPLASLRFRWVIEGGWKLILPHAPVEPDASPELYRVDEDPREERELAARHPEVAARLARRLDAWWPVE